MEVILQKFNSLPANQEPKVHDLVEWSQTVGSVLTTGLKFNTRSKNPS